MNPILLDALERGAIEHPHTPEVDFAATEERIAQLTRTIRASANDESFVRRCLRLLHLDKVA